MIQSFYTGVTGMKAFQEGLSVTSNNIANAQTVGYKKQKAIFDDLLYKNTAGSLASDTAGTNPMSIGSGVKLSGASTDYTGGSLTVTNGKLDAALDGKGFFIVGDANATKDTANTNEYTRKGTFSLSNDYKIVNSEGKYVLGYPLDENGEVTGDEIGPIQIKDPEQTPGEGEPVETDYAITDNGYVVVQYSDGTSKAVAQLAVATFPNENGLLKTGNGNYKIAPASGDAIVGLSGENGAGTVRGGTTEASNVDLSAEFVDLMLFQKGFQGNSKAVKVSDDVLNDIINLIR